MADCKRWISHSAPTIGTAEARALREVIESGFIGYGPVAAELEERIRQRTGRKYALAVLSGFHALSLAVRGLDLPRRSIVSIPVLTCPSVLAAVEGSGHRVWLADIQEEDLTIDVGAVSRDCAAAIAPHAYGAPVDAVALDRLGVPWIEDCATSPATVVNGRRAGASGTLAVFSFGSTKYITGGTGGALATDDDALAARVEDLLEFERFERRGKWTHEVPTPLPHRLPDLNAAVALVQMQRLDELASRRRAIASIYKSGLREISGLRLPGVREQSYYRYIIRTEIMAVNLVEALRERGIDARSSVNPWLHLMPACVTRVMGGPWPVADGWRDHLLSLPIHPSMSDEEAWFIVESLIELLKRNRSQ